MPSQRSTENLNSVIRNHGYTEMGMPLIRGPFRGVLISFHAATNFDSFEEAYGSMVLKHTNFYKAFCDKHKCIIYYKNAYDAATVISKYRATSNFYISLYYDQISRTLHPEVLYVAEALTTDLSRMIEQLKGEVVSQSKMGIQIYFGSFKSAAIAHEELRRQYHVKFAYKSEVPNLSKPKPKPQTSDTQLVLPNVTAEEVKAEPENSYGTEMFQVRSKIQDDISTLVLKYKSMTPMLMKELQLVTNQLNGNESKPNIDTKKVSNNLERPNKSWNQEIDLEDKRAEKCKKKISESMIKLQKLYNDLEKVKKDQ